MEPKFKIGDKVRILETAKNHPWFSSLGMSSYVGSICTIKNIIAISSSQATDGHIYELCDMMPYHWDASMFELVESAEEKEPESEYNIGDVVEILPRIHKDTDYPHTYVDEMCSLAGGKYTITNKYKCDYKSGKIEDDGFIYILAETGNWNWSSSMFKKAEQEKFQKQKKQTEKLEPVIGEIFDYKGKKYVCIESNRSPEETCENCSFRKVNCGFLTCTRKRKDGKDVYFQEILGAPLVSSDYSEQNCGTSTNAISKPKSIIEYIMGLNKKPNYKLKFKL